MIQTTSKGKTLYTKLIQTSDTGVQLTLMDIAISPVKTRLGSFRVYPATLKCYVLFHTNEVFLGTLKPKYRHLLMNKHLRLSKLQVTGLDEELNMKYRYLGINLEMEILD